MIDIQIALRDLGLERSLVEAQRRTRNLRPAMSAIGEYFIGKIDREFRTESDPLNRPWAKLSKATLERKQRRGKITKILQEEGLMRASFSYEASDRSVIVGTNDPKAKYHQTGTRKMPQRKILPESAGDLTAEDNQEIGESITDYLLRGF